MCTPSYVCLGWLSASPTCKPCCEQRRDSTHGSMSPEPIQWKPNVGDYDICDDAEACSSRNLIPFMDADLNVMLSVREYAGAVSDCFVLSCQALRLPTRIRDKDTAIHKHEQIFFPCEHVIQRPGRIIFIEQDQNTLIQQIIINPSSCIHQHVWRCAPTWSCRVLLGVLRFGDG